LTGALNSALLKVRTRQGEKAVTTKILVVDDSSTVRMLQTTTMKGEGYEVEEAANGVEALKRILEFRPDIVLMDVVMPEMGGIQCLRQIKAHPQIKHTKVIMVTTLGEEENIETAFASGCDDYVTKPIRKLDLLTKIRTLLEKM